MKNKRKTKQNTHKGQSADEKIGRVPNFALFFLVTLVKLARFISDVCSHTYPVGYIDDWKVCEREHLVKRDLVDVRASAWQKYYPLWDRELANSPPQNNAGVCFVFSDVCIFTRELSDRVREEGEGGEETVPSFTCRFFIVGNAFLRKILHSFRLA